MLPQKVQVMGVCVYTILDRTYSSQEKCCMSSFYILDFVLNPTAMAECICVTWAQHTIEC